MTEKHTAQPFFARFLEGQFPTVSTDLRAGDGGVSPTRTRPIVMTMKYPSDDDELTTLKYPSDSDET